MDMTKEQAKELVKRKLWSHGYNARSVDNIPGVGYDLLVQSRYMVKVMLLDVPAKEDSEIGPDIVIATVSKDGYVYYSSRGKNPVTSPGAMFIKN